MTKVDYIPDGIIADILAKLPPKSALRFKTACKTWYSLISDPLFINLHSKQASQNPKILLSTTDSHVQILDYERESFDNSCLSALINVPEKLSFNDAEIIGSSYGLVCIDTDGRGESFCIWNPSTGESRKIPNLDMNSDGYYFDGFGYDLVTSDFKLVISIDTFTYNIFSLKANSWKKITCPLGSEYYHCYLLSWSSLVLNGIFHWVVVTSSSHCEILAFDVANESFEKLQLPADVSLSSRLIASLFEHRGCLCVSFSKPEAHRFKEKQIWMKKEYGGWIHLLTIKNPPSCWFHLLPFLCVSTRNEVVCLSDQEFIRSRRENNNLDEIRIETYVYGAVLYVETLVSPNTQNGLQLPIKRCNRQRS